MSTEAQMAVARAALDPQAALDALGRARLETVEPEVVAGVPAPMRTLALTFAVEVDPPPPHRRWRFFVFYCLVKLAAWVYPFQFEIYRTREPWE